MQFIDLEKQQKRIRDKIDQNIKKVLDHGKYINGPEMAELENRLADYCGTKYAIGCSNGTEALLMALMAYDIGPGDAIFSTAFTFIATSEVARILKATPVFVDIDKTTYNIDSNGLEDAIKKVIKDGKLKPRCVIPVDLFGQCADMDEINKIADKYELMVIEDAAQSFGAEYKGRKACSLAHVATTSFFPAKPLGCYGDGGMIFTNDKSMYETIVSIRIHGKGTDKYDNIRIGLNGRLDTIQAAILLAKFDIFEEEIALRQAVADYYSRGLSDCVTIPVIRDYNRSVWAQYCVRHPERDRIMGEMKKDGIPIMIYYPKPLHLQGAFGDLGYSIGDFPVSEAVSNDIFALPMYPYLGKEEQDMVISSLRKAIGK